MNQIRPEHLTAALRRRGYLLSWWPWRALAYLLLSLPLSTLPGLGLAVAAAPLLAVISAARNDRPVALTVVLFLTVLSIGVLASAPLVSIPFAGLDRQRLRIVDNRPLSARAPEPLRSRYTGATGWRESAFLVWLAAVVPLGAGMLGLFALMDSLLIATPWVAGHNDPVTIVGITATSFGAAVPYAVLGVLLIPALGYLVGLLAAAQAAVTRGLLGGSTDELREVSRSRARLVDSYEAERRRIERDLHDAAQPRLTSLALQLGLARVEIPDDSPAAAPLARAHEQAKGLMTLLRQIVHGIRPQSLTDLGLAGAVRELANNATVPVVVRADIGWPVPEVTETTAYYVISEALGNVVRHTSATLVEVTMLHRGRGRGLVIEVQDNGHGGADPARGSGLTGLADRVAAVDGRLLLASPGGGPTTVRAELPCHR